MDNLMVFSISADVFCLILCIMGLTIFTLLRKTLTAGSSKMLAVFFSIGLTVACNLIGLLFKGLPGKSVHLILICSNFGEFAFNYLTSYSLSRYFIHRLCRVPSAKPWKRIAAALCTFNIAILIISQFTGWYYTIDSANFYHRGPIYIASIILGTISVFYTVAIVLYFGKSMRTAEKMAFGLFIMLPMVAMAIQPLFYGIYIILLANTIGLVIMFLVFLYFQSQNYYEKQQELSDMRLNIAISQIQPHFIFNALNAIHYLCKKDPPLAQKSLEDFATYLRGNLDSVKHKTPVPFSTEQKHVFTYLSLEQLRYQDELNVVWDLQCTNFSIPSLTIQPLVENAVKHGVGMKPEGGTVVVTTREFPYYYQVTISDDGVGFDPSVKKEDGRNHVGIENVRARLDSMCNGSLIISSTIGAGTVAEIQIPKNNVENRKKKKTTSNA